MVDEAEEGLKRLQNVVQGFCLMFWSKESQGREGMFGESQYGRVRAMD